MNTYIFQVISGLRVTDKTCGFSGNDTDYQSMITPMASYLLLAGDTGDPTHPHFQRFLCWCSANWERVWFVAGQMETGHEGVCRCVASKLHNVRFMQRQVEWGIPGLHIVGASCWPPEQAEAHASFLADHSGPDALLLTYGVPSSAPNATCRSLSLDSPAPSSQEHTDGDTKPVLECMHWVYGRPTETFVPRGVINQYRTPGKMYDHTFYITVTVNPATFHFQQGTDAFPAKVVPTVVRTVEARMPHTADNMCFYCGHRNHSKLRCPLIQCNSCLQFGHNERVCKVNHEQLWNKPHSTNGVRK
jgi:hypothetical protein